MLDVSANHLQAVENIEKLCLLLSVDVSANNILKVIKKPVNTEYFFISPKSQENLLSGFPAMSNTNLVVQPQKMARGLKYQI